MGNIDEKINEIPKLLQDKFEMDNLGTIEVIFMPYFDDNELWITYENRVSKAYPQTEFSTFVKFKEQDGKENEMIIMKIGKNLLLFKRNGDFM